MISRASRWWALSLAAVVAVGGAVGAAPPTPVDGAGGGGAAAEYAKKSDLGFQWSGDVSFRLESRLPRNAPVQNRFRARLRIGATGSFLGEQAFWGFRLATNTTNPVSRYLTLGGADANGGGANFGIDQAYLGFLPHRDLTVIVGKVPAPLGYWTSPAVFDSDVTAEGLTVRWDLHRGQAGDLVRNVSSTSGIYTVRDIPTKASDPYAFLTQFKGNLGPTTLGLGVYHVTGLNSLLNAATLATLSQWQTTISFPQDRMTILQFRAEYPFKVARLPVVAGGEFLWNVERRKHNIGYQLSLDFPKVGPGQLGLQYRESNQNSAVSPWVDSELGEGTGYRAGVQVSYSVPVSKHVTAGINYYRWDTFRPLTTGRGPTVNKLQLEVGASF